MYKNEYLFTNSPQQGICPAQIQLLKILAEVMFSSHPDNYLGVPQCGASAACFHWCANCCAGTECIHCCALVVCNRCCCTVRKLWSMHVLPPPHTHTHTHTHTTTQYRRFLSFLKKCYSNCSQL